MAGSAHSSGEFTLRPHQREAVEAIVRGLSEVPGDEARGTVVMATGTGKTLTAAAAAHRLVPDGKVGVLVPTLDLLTQTVEAWRRAGRRGPMVAVCSLSQDPMLEALGVRCTTDPWFLARWASVPGPVTVLMTYASLVPQNARESGGGDAPDGRAGVIEEAVRAQTFTGPALPAFDLLVVDEAHRTSGDAGKAWAMALDNDRLPARRRLFMTATPRIWEAVPSVDGWVRPVASMTDPGLYGERLYELELTEAVERGLLARWEIDVLEITDPTPGEDEGEAPGAGEGPEVGQGRGGRLAALQAALLAHLDDTGARSLLSFHSTTLDAMVMARSMPETAARLHADDPARYPARVSSEWLSGEHAPAYRRRVLARFADGLDERGYVADAQILASCQVLTEGVDIRGRAGVDGVVLADGRSSPVQVVQIIGRALRQEPGEGKIARIIVPIFLEPGEEPDAMMSSPAYRPLAQLLAGLRAHDHRLIERLTEAAGRTSGTASDTIALDPVTAAGQESGAREHETREHGGQKHEDAGEHRGRGMVPVLRFSRPRDPASVARFLRTRVLTPESLGWLAGYDALLRWTTEHGSAEVPAAATIDLPGRPGYRVGAWVVEQRRALREGTLRPHRYELLTEAGIVWDVADAKFTNGLIAARAYFEKNGTLAAPRDAVVDGFPIGQFLDNLRKRQMVLTDQRDAALSAIDPRWNPPWPLAWERGRAALTTLLEGEETVPEIPPGVRVNGTDVGTWLRRQLAGWNDLDDAQCEALAKLGIPAPTTAGAGGHGGAGNGRAGAAAGAAAGVPGLAGLDAFGRGVAALRQYRDREGHLTIPRAHEEVLHPAPGENGGPVTVRAGVFLTNQKTRRAKLSPERRAALADLGLQWAQ
ncbi:DEAD/DEAH box helicase [Streptomyces alkaliphilus]|uniref:DEAD/DEAH box helicase n=1 Tax=Streptomyces alkaliphilus TaxID=1472722 RepID=UPI002B207A2A|nr:Helicase associated domain protein [Streptomyces alkaliphilus]